MELIAEKNIEEQVETNPEVAAQLQMVNLAESLLGSFGEKSVYNAFSGILGFEKTPPTIEEFMYDEEWLGDMAGTNIYLPWRQALSEIFPNPFQSPFSEIIFTGCLTGDTKIDLLDGRSVPIKDLVKEYGNKKKFWVLCYNTDNNSWEPAKAYDARMTDSNAPVWKITLDNGESFSATENHPVLTSDNKKIEVKDLKIGQSLKSYTKVTNEHGYDVIWRHDDECYNLLHKVVAEWKLGISVRDMGKRSDINNSGTNHVVHHKDFKKKNNTPENLCRTTWSSHFRYHRKNATKWWESSAGEKERLRRKSEYTKESHWKNWQEAGASSPWRNSEEANEISRTNLQNWRESFDNYEDYLAALKGRQLKGLKVQWSDPERHRKASEFTTKRMKEGLSKQMSDKRWSDPSSKDQPRKVITEFNSKPENQKLARKGKVLSFLNKVVSEFGRISIEEYNKYRKKVDGYKSTLTGIAKAFSVTFEELPYIWSQVLDEAENYNHKVVKIEYIGREPVYSISVDHPSHNYPLTAGIPVFNSVGTGKSTIGILGALYDLIKFCHYSDPHGQFGLMKSTTVCCAVLNATLSLVSGVLVDQIHAFMNSSAAIKGIIARSSGKTLFPKNIDIISGSRSSHFLGRAVAICIQDEMNFDRVNDQAMDAYNVLKARIESRFFQESQSSYPGRMWLISSKKSETDFLEKHIQGSLSNPATRVYNYAIWEIQKYKKGVKYTGETFPVFVGDEHKDPQLLIGRSSHGYSDERIIHVPIEYRERFEYDLIIALRDLAGMSTGSVFKYISSIESIDRSLKLPNPVHKEVVMLDFYDSADRLFNYIDAEKFIIPQYRYAPRFIHLDMAIKHDKMGIASSFVSDHCTFTRMDPGTGTMVQVTSPTYITEFVMAVEARSMSEIPFYKIKEFLLTLEKEGYPLAGVTADGFQSSNILQDLKLMGIDASLLSVDRTKEPYETLKEAILEGRWIGPKHQILRDEIKGLNDVGKKIDHPSDGSKDISDACLTGDTLIPLMDGTTRKISEIKDMIDNCDDNIYVYSCTENGSVVPGHVINAMDNGTREIVRVYLDNERYIDCTDDHLFMLRTGKYVKASELNVSDSLMPLYRKMSEDTEGKMLTGYETIWDNNAGKWVYTHYVSAGKMPFEKFTDEKGKWITKPVVHHKWSNEKRGFDKRDNRPTMVEWLDWKTHRETHCERQSELMKQMWSDGRLDGQYERTPRQREIARQNITKWNKSEERLTRMRDNGSFDRAYKAGIGKWLLSEEAHDIMSERSKIENIRRVEEGCHNFQTGSRNSLGFLGKEPENREKVLKKSSLKRIKSRIRNFACSLVEQSLEITEEVWNSSKPTGRNGGLPDYYRIFTYYDSIEELLEEVRHYNHKVVKVEKLGYRCQVYDLTVETFHNFAIDSGIFVHNCAGSIYSAYKNYLMYPNYGIQERAAGSTQGLSTLGVQKREMIPIDKYREEVEKRREQNRPYEIGQELPYE